MLPLNSIPPGSDVFLDANIFVYGLSRTSPQCASLLAKCAKEEITGITLFETVSEATHHFMIAEAHSKGLITAPNARGLRTNFRVIPLLSQYWAQTERIFSLNLLFLSAEAPTLRGAQKERATAGLLTNDSIIVSCMRQYGISRLASADRDFARVSGITLHQPTDLP